MNRRRQLLRAVSLQCPAPRGLNFYLRQGEKITPGAIISPIIKISDLKTYLKNLHNLHKSLRNNSFNPLTVGATGRDMRGKQIIVLGQSVQPLASFSSKRDVPSRT